MKYVFNLFIFLIFLFIVFIPKTFAQDSAAIEKNEKEIIVSAGPEYKRSSLHNFLWGRNNRTEWATPVKLPMLWLDTARGGLVPYKAGGGNQTKSLHLKNAIGEEYALRSVNKTLGKVLPENFKNTFIEKIVNDQVSMSFPYGHITVPLMAQSAGIYHTWPQYIYLPQQPALDSFNKKFGNDVYLFEERLKGDWKHADNLGNFENFYDTEKLREKLFEDNDNQVDQKAFIKARLFDFLLGNWDRHELQWAWGVVEKGNQKIFEPIPQDMDQVYFKYDGLLLSLGIAASGMSYFQSFRNNFGNINTFNYEERGLDRLLTNQASLSDWQNIARALQQSLTDSVIENAVHQMPPEIFAISGETIISKLKIRRSHLADEATKYYRFLSKEVEIIGTADAEYFDVKRINDVETSVHVYKINKEGLKKNVPFYSRNFKSDETKEIRLFGLSGNDRYKVDGNVNKGIMVRIIGGTGKDSIISNSVVSGGGKRTHIYDDANNSLEVNSKTRLHISSDSSIHEYVYKSFLYDKNGIKPTVFYNNEDRFYAGIGYGWLHHKWRRLPFVYKQDISVNYSITQKAFSINYQGLFPNLIGKWDLALKANYDFIRWRNFYGLGNETALIFRDRNFNRVRSKEAFASVGLKRKFGSSTLQLSGFFQGVTIINDTARFIAKNLAGGDPNVFKQNTFVGAQLTYTLVHLKDSIVPVSGFIFYADASYAQNLKQSNKAFGKYSATLQFYVPLVSKFSLAISSGAATVSGKPEFYQYASIGGGQNLRGFRLDRFWGKTAVYNSNELRFISNIKTYLFNGKAGLVAFFDNGRVWMPGERSNTWHTAYGGGILIAPFNKIFADITYGISNEEKLLQLRLSKVF